MSKNILSWSLLVLLSFIWGSSFILMKRGMTALDGTPIFTHTQVAALRMAIASTALLPLTIMAFKKIKNLKKFLLFFIIGMTANFMPAFLFTYAETEVSSGFAGMLNSFTPIFTVIISVLIFGQKMKPMQVFGTFVAITGSVLLMFSGYNISFTGSWSHILAIVLATLFYGISMNLIKFKLSDFKPMEVTALCYGSFIVPAYFVLFASGTHEVIQSSPKAIEGLFFISILALVGTAFSGIIFNKLIANSTTIFSSSVTYFIPIVAIFIGFLIGENINMNQVGSMAIIIIGVFTVNFFSSKKDINFIKLLKKSRS